MAISVTSGILAMLKTYYAKEGLVNLLYRNDPLLKDIKKERVEGKQQNFSALYSRGGAVSANATVAEKLAKETAQAKEFQVVPGQLFSACLFSNKELLASKSLKGAYINVAAAKFFANAESFRKTMAVALYGTGHGELYTTSDAINVIAGDVDVTMPRYAIMGIDIGSSIVYKASASANDNTGTAVIVKKINGTTVTLTGTATATVAAGSVACLEGCTDSDGNPLLPVGLAGWLPTQNTTAALDSFYGVNRSDARDRLAGVYVAGTATQKKYEVIQDAMLKLRAQGSLCDKIVMNDEDFLAMNKELEDKTYFQKVDGGKKGKATLGYDGFGFAVSTNWLDNVIDSPYCPKGTAYILSSDTIELWTYTNADKIADGISGNEPGAPEVTGETDVQNKPYQLLVDDMFSIKAGETGVDGDCAIVKLNFFGTFVITRPAVNGVVTFAA